MSSLLDVLHKRPSRSQLAAADDGAAVAAVTPAANTPPAEIRLAPELELTPGPQTPPRGSVPAAAAALEMASPEVSAPASPGGESTVMRRWSDPVAAPTAAADPPRIQAAPVSARPLKPSRTPLLAVLLAVAAVFGAWLVYQFSGSEPEGFLAAPDASSTVAAAPVANPDAPASPVAAPPRVKPARKTRKNLPVAAAADDADVAWYDQPALPDAAGAHASANPVIQITRDSDADPVFEQLRDAWAALQAGDNAHAESLYRAVLSADPGSIDALLGLGSLATRGGRLEEARDLYAQVQRLDPKNSTAAAGLSMLPGTAAQSNTESQIKSMLREQPDSASLHFALGLKYVAEQRWPDAQLAFFDAVRHQPTNADYAFNLAVSLDRLGQVQPAASYYQRALDLAAGSQQFDVATARARLDALRGPQG